ncbi:hypothetical protein MMC20_006046 [Loxospora ochrophaea]|nr:hypothetical protein [Loxospora ochrophaea]
MFSALLSILFFLVPSLLASPLNLVPRQSPLPIPDQSPYFSDYNGTAVPYPGNHKAPIPPTASGPPGADDVLFQNLIQAEWAIFSFYQQGVEMFNASAFVDAGYPADTYQRIVEIRDNEAGHGVIFQNAISNTSIKPGLCDYDFGPTIQTPTGYLAGHTILEISSMAFLTGLAVQAQIDTNKAALLAIAETESRHQAWGLIEIWQQDPFAGPVDTVYPYANQILTTTGAFIVPGSCPAANPPFPNPNQNLPTLTYVQNSTTLLPGSPVTFEFSDPKNQPKFQNGTTYYAVFFHGLTPLTESFDSTTYKSVIPAAFEAKGLILAVIADTPGAPTADSIVAGPMFIYEQPIFINGGGSG